MTSDLLACLPLSPCEAPPDPDGAALTDARRHADRGDPHEGLAIADRVLAAARGRADPALIAKALCAVAMAARALADYPRAIAACDEALEIAAPEATQLRVDCALCRAHVFLDLGDYDRALGAVGQAQAFAGDPPAAALQARFLQFEAMIQARLQDFEAAEAAYVRALEIARVSQDDQTIALLHNSLGVLHLRLGQPEPGERGDAKMHLRKALDCFEASRPHAERAGDARLAMLLDGNIAGTLGELGRLTEARDAFARQLDAARAQHDRHDEALILINLGEAHRRLGDFDEAIDVLHEALALAEASRVKARQRRAHRELSMAHEGAGDAAAALAHFKVFHALDRDAYASPARGTLRAQVLQDEIARVQREADSLRREQERLARANAELAQQAHEDPLTGVANRRMLDEALREAAAADEPVAIAAFDLDRFKSINDRHSHAIGDAVLRVFAAILREACRNTDLPARVGGEEFVLLLRRATPAEACAAAERVRAVVQAYRWDALASGLRVTVSAGVAGGVPHRADALLRRADEALYRAKHAGRNRVVAVEGADAAG